MLEMLEDLTFTYLDIRAIFIPSLFDVQSFILNVRHSDEVGFIHNAIFGFCKQLVTSSS